MEKIDLEKVKKVYFIGIKGSGMIAFVEIFNQMGVEVAGSDTEEKFFTDETLEKLGVKYYEKFSEQNIENEMPLDLVVYSTAYSEESNPELKYVLEKKIPCFSYPEMIGMFMEQKYGIAVCGTHGKTTTSAMLALAMKNAEADPSAIIGSKVKQLDSNVMIGRSEYFIIEADEYQNKFLHYMPRAVILTNLDYDHPDFFPSFEQYRKVFAEFVKKIPSDGILVVWGESEFTLEIAKQAECRIVFYGSFLLDKENSSREIVPGEERNEELIQMIKNEFAVLGKRDVEFFLSPSEHELPLKVVGIHNRLNATAVLALCGKLGLDRVKVEESLSQFEGTARRFERIGKRSGAVIIDDYAHHPREVRATLAAAKIEYPDKNIICLFHPHTFSRTKALLDDFSESFSDADEVIVLDIYGSAREGKGDVRAEDLVEKIKKLKQNVRHIATLEGAYEHLVKNLGPEDLLITMGAGNVFEVAHRLAGKNRKKNE